MLKQDVELLLHASPPILALKQTIGLLYPKCPIFSQSYFMTLDMIPPIHAHLTISLEGVVLSNGIF
jgi:hypothetical protein